jgi:hypothetical protein
VCATAVLCADHLDDLTLTDALFARFFDPALEFHHGIPARFGRAPTRLRVSRRMPGLLCSLAFTLREQLGALFLPVKPLRFVGFSDRPRRVRDRARHVAAGFSAIEPNYAVPAGMLSVTKSCMQPC